MHPDTRLAKFKRPEGRAEIYVMFAVCRALGDLSERVFCLLHISIATVGRPPFRPFLRAVRRCRCLKAVCAIKWGLGWFRHKKGRLLYFKSDTLRARPPLQLAMVLRGSSSEHRFFLNDQCHVFEGTPSKAA